MLILKCLHQHQLILLSTKIIMSGSNRATDAISVNNDQHIQGMRREDPMPEFTEDEEDLIARVFRLVGKRWSLIAGRIRGRTAEEIEKYWTSKSSSTTDQSSSFA